MWLEMEFQYSRRTQEMKSYWMRNQLKLPNWNDQPSNALWFLFHWVFEHHDWVFCLRKWFNYRKFYLHFIYSNGDKIYVLQQTTIILMENNSVVHILLTIETSSTQMQTQTVQIKGKNTMGFWCGVNDKHSNVFFSIARKRISNIPHCWHISSCKLRWFTSPTDYIALFNVPSFFYDNDFIIRFGGGGNGGAYYVYGFTVAVWYIKNMLHYQFHSLVRITIITTWFEPSDRSFTGCYDFEIHSALIIKDENTWVSIHAIA